MHPMQPTELRGRLMQSMNTDHASLHAWLPKSQQEGLAYPESNKCTTNYIFLLILYVIGYRSKLGDINP